MTITREQVADLQPGDVVRASEDVGGNTDVITIQGRVRRTSNGFLVLGGYTLASPEGDPGAWLSDITVISHAPRPLYVNHPRTKPTPGDVARCESGDGALTVCWIYDGGRARYGWHETSSETFWGSEIGWPQIRLLVDGETGEVVR